VRRTIAYRVIVYVAATLVVVLGVAAVLALRGLEDRSTDLVFLGGDRLATTLKRSLRHAMLNDDREAIAQAVKAVSAGEEPLELRIYNKDGRVMFASDEAELGRQVPLTERACAGCHQAGRPSGTLDARHRSNVFVAESGGRFFQRIEPIYNERDCSSAACHVHPAGQKVLGVMDLTQSMDSVDEGLATFRRDAIGVAVLVVALTALVILLLVRRLVTRRIGLLVDGTRRISGGDLEHRIPDLGHDEFGVLATSFNDMTARLQETRGSLLRSERLASLGRLSAGLAHEINNPLTGVLLHAGSLMDGLAQDDPRRATVQVVVDETKRCRDVVRGLLDFSRQRAPVLQTTRIGDAIGRALSVMRPQADARGIRFEADGTDDVPEVRADPAQLHQVLLNLLLNAVDASADGAIVRVKARAAGDGGAEIDVADEGSGIPAEQLAHIFEPFFTTKEGKGTGLGLAVCWGILEQHGGTIRVVSEAGRGSTFTVVLPGPEGRGEGGR
jgi:two-component system NtrC family sensor kinase